VTLFVVGLVLFFGIHSVAIVASDWRQRTIERIGLRPWKGTYTLVSLASFAMLAYGYGLARQDPIVLYTPSLGMRHLTLLLMVPVFPLVHAAYLPGRIKATLKHPMLVALKLWAFAHLLANGTLADLLLFGGFLTWAVLDRISFKRRTQPDLRTAPPGKYNDLIAIVTGLIVYVIFAKWLHLYLIGVYPLPF